VQGIRGEGRSSLVGLATPRAVRPRRKGLGRGKRNAKGIRIAKMTGENL
jgi:hypothetical protein